MQRKKEYTYLLSVFPLPNEGVWYDDYECKSRREFECGMEVGFQRTGVPSRMVKSRVTAVSDDRKTFTVDPPVKLSSYFKSSVCYSLYGDARWHIQSMCRDVTDGEMVDE